MGGGERAARHGDPHHPLAPRRVRGAPRRRRERRRGGSRPGPPGDGAAECAPAEPAAARDDRAGGQAREGARHPLQRLSRRARWRAGIGEPHPRDPRALRRHGAPAARLGGVEADRGRGRGRRARARRPAQRCGPLARLPDLLLDDARVRGARRGRALRAARPRRGEHDAAVRAIQGHARRATGDEVRGRRPTSSARGTTAIRSSRRHPPPRSTSIPGSQRRISRR